MSEAEQRVKAGEEEGSVTDAPLEWEPAQWRLLPGQPNSPTAMTLGPT